MILQRLYISIEDMKSWVLVLATAKGIKRVAHVMCLCAVVCTYVYVEHAVCCRLVGPGGVVVCEGTPMQSLCCWTILSLACSLAVPVHLHARAAGLC
jgi:hypothetical protein